VSAAPHRTAALAGNEDESNDLGEPLHLINGFTTSLKERMEGEATL
jgi:hypothetical protein